MFAVFRYIKYILYFCPEAFATVIETVHSPGSIRLSDSQLSWYGSFQLVLKLLLKSPSSDMCQTMG